MATTPTITTAEQLLAAGDIGRCELIRGELIMMSPAGFEHGRAGTRILQRLSAYVEEHQLGEVVGPDAGFILEREPDTVRAADVAFVKRDRLTDQPIEAFFPAAPDLAVEVISPSDRPGEVLQKVGLWLACGTSVVWVVHLRRQTLTVYDAGASPTVFTLHDIVTCDDLLPGFRLVLAEIFR